MVLGVALSVMVFGAVAQAEEPVRLRVGLRGDPQVWVEDLIPKFHEQHPDIIIDFVDGIEVKS